MRSHQVPCQMQRPGKGADGFPSPHAGPAGPVSPGAGWSSGEDAERLDCPWNLPAAGTNRKTASRRPGPAQPGRNPPALLISPAASFPSGARSSPR